jgi:hypothetical protein
MEVAASHDTHRENVLGGGPELDLFTVGRLLAENARNAQREPASVWLPGTLLCVRNRAGRRQLFRANPVQRLFEQRRGRQNIVLKARQMGLTTWIAGQFFLKTISSSGVLSVQVAHTREAAESIFACVRRMWENLPDAWKTGPLRRARANAGQMVFGELDSEFRVISAGEENAGRGLTIQNLHLSEVSRWPGHAHETLAGLRAALAPEGELTLESTPHGASGAFYEEWTHADESGLVRHFFPWWLEPRYTGPPAANYTPEEQALVSRHGLTAPQIGFRRSLERSFRGLRAQEYAEDAESCFRASGDGCFAIEPIERRLSELHDPLETRRGGALQIWFPPVPYREYLLGVDSAGGGADGDYAAVQVIERVSGLQCAELRERLGPLELARVSAALAREYGHALIAVERNNHGAAVLAYLDATERYDRVYGQDGVAGWLTTAGNKPAMVSRIGALLEEGANLFYSRRLLAECRSFITYAGGRTGAAAGTHDDCLMAMAVAQTVRAA